MDPNEALRELLELSQAVNVKRDHDDGRQDYSIEAVDMAEHVQALDGWLSKGGFLPKRWEREES